MRKVFVLLLFLMPFQFLAQNVEIEVEVTPSNFEQTDSITLTIRVDEEDFGVTGSHALYLWAWSIDKAGETRDAPTNAGDFNAPNAARLNLVSSTHSIGIYTFTLSSVEEFYGRNEPLDK